MPAVEGSVWQFRSRELLDADQPVHAVNAPRQGEHQREGMLRARDIGAPAHAENRHTGGAACGHVDVAQHGAVFVDRLEMRRTCKLLASYREGFDDQGTRRGEIIAQLHL